MSENEPEIRQAVIDWVAAAGTAGENCGEHPDAETLAAYHARELPEEEERRVQDHLLVCRECAELLLDLEGLGDPDFGQDVEIPAGTDEALWERLRQEIRDDPRPTLRAEAAPATVVPFAPRRRNAPPPWMSALAAALLVAVIGLSVWVASLRQTVRDLSLPEVNAPVLEPVLSGIGQREGGPAPAAEEVSSGVRLFALILSPVRRGDFQDYDVEISRAGGGVVRRETGLRPNAYGSFSLIETRSSLGPGDYQIRLFGIGSGGQRENLGEYALRVAP